MDFDVVLLARFLITGIALVLAFLAVATWSRRKDAPEAATVAILVATMALYAFGYAGEIAQTELGPAVRWLNVEYLAVPWAGALWILAAWKHKGIRGRASLLFVVPVVVFVGQFTNYKSLFYAAPLEMAQRGPFYVLVVHRGPLLLLHSAYLLVAFLAGSGLYLTGLRHASTLARKQAAVFVTASLVPISGYFVSVAGLSPWRLDLTPITLGITCGLIFYGMFYCGIFELAPMARNLIFNGMRDAVLILDTRDRLLDFNPAAKALLPVLNKKNLGTDVIPMMSAMPSLAEALAKAEDKIEVNLGMGDGTGAGVEGDEPRFFELRTWPLSAVSMHATSRSVARAVIFADVTAQVRLREELRRRAETDALTGIANRRRFHQALEIECMRFTRGHAPLSILMIDLDFFKEINDRYGHPAGDAVLKSIAELLVSLVRKTDLPARYGGEEFAVLLPETRVDGARVIAERIRVSVEKEAIAFDGKQIEVKVSVGVAGHVNDLEAKPEILLKKVDRALYQAKTKGRNRVESA
jgi:diguanylate cyclase (GGDEF)-like protein